MSVQVYKTSVTSPDSVRELASGLDALAGKGCWNFALDDCDRILRIVAQVEPSETIEFMSWHGFECEELPD